MSDRYNELRTLADAFLDAFNRNDLDAVMAFFTDDAVYKELQGRVSEGKDAIRKAFAPQFEGAFGRMEFVEDDTFIDADAGKIMSSWDLHLDLDGERKVLSGLDLLEFRGKKIACKQTYVKSKAPLYVAR